MCGLNINIFEIATLGFASFAMTERWILAPSTLLRTGFAGMTILLFGARNDGEVTLGVAK